MSDKINPEHYKQLPVEAIQIIESVIDNAPSNQDAYLHGQVLKYILRCWNKNGIEDLRKAKWYLDRLIEHCDELLLDANKGLVKAWTCENGKAKQVYPEPKWTPKVGDWVRIKKPSETLASSIIWFEKLDRYDGRIIQVKQIEDYGIVHDDFGFSFDWLEPAEAPKPDPGEGYRLLSKNPPEKLLDTDEGLFAYGLDGQKWLSVYYSSGEQLPSVYYRRKIDVATLKQSPQLPDGWRWLEVGEVIRKGDSYWYGARWYDFDCSIGEQLATDMWPSIRRNRFEVGEKVVWITDDTVWTYMSEINDGRNHPKSAWVKSDGTSLRTCVNNLAPYIEEAK